MNSTCPTDDRLLAAATDEPDSDDLREHIGQCADCQARMKKLSGELTELRKLSNSMSGQLDAPSVIRDGDSLLPNSTMIGRYVIVASLGSGGQADVYRVIDPNLGRQLVLKLSRQISSSDSQRRDAILAEGRLLAELDHPGVVRIFDVGIFDSRPYLVLEHVTGRNLEQTYAAKTPSAYEAAKLISEVASTVAFAHRRGIVHGDITPRNILIDADGHARLIDFGLSKFEDAWGEKSSLSGGTPEFLAPEAVPTEGRLRHAGPAGDVFGLGATLYWLLTSQPPFIGGTIAEILERARDCDIDFDAFRRAHVPGRIARICQQALAASPADRPAPHLFADELKRASRRWMSTRRLAAIAALIVFTAAMMLGLFVFLDDAPNDSVAVLHSTPTVSIFRRDGVRTLSNELPLRTGDRLAVSSNFSRGQAAVVIWFDTAGELKQLQPMRDVVDKIDRLIYPAPRKSFALDTPEGTEMFFFCRGQPISDDDLKECFPRREDIPILPPHNWVTLQRSETKVEGPLKSDVPDEIVQLEGKMKEIDRQLRRHFQGVSGIAFPHRAESDPAK